MKTNNFKVVIDCDIPFIKGVLEPYCSPVYLKGNEINSENISNARALIIRTRTKCNKELLQGSQVRAIFTATIGSDHLDLDYCQREQISLFNAAGCNAHGVVQHVLTTLFALMCKKDRDLTGQTIGIIGAGNVGERLAQLAEKIGFTVLRCDPPKSIISNKVPYYDLNYVLNKSQIVTLHVPLNEETKNICSNRFIEKMQKGAFLVNTSRGEVVDQAAIIENREKLGGLIVDVWGDEPNINLNYLSCVDIATPHIAGYSLEGKINATVMSVLNFAKFFKIKELNDFMIEPPMFEITHPNNIAESSVIESVARILLNIYPVWEQDLKLRSNPEFFEQTRSEYIYRRELNQGVIKTIEKLLLKVN